MERRNFIKSALGTTFLIGVSPQSAAKEVYSITTDKKRRDKSIAEVLVADVAVIGGGLGGFTSAYSLLKQGKSVVMTEETDWIGGQLTSQGVPPDEHRWIETTGATELYRDYRTKVRDYYKNNYPLIESAMKDPLLNPGRGGVSRLCHEPKVALTILESYLAPFISSGRLKLLLNHKVKSAHVENDEVRSVVVEDMVNKKSKQLNASYFVDATELGDLLPLTGTEYVTGTESRLETRELHAPEKANPENVQAFTMCFAMDYVPGENHTIAKPKSYNFWKNHIPPLKPEWPGKLLSLQYSNPRTLEPRALDFNPNGTRRTGILNLWNYRKIIDRKLYKDNLYGGDITIVNWPINDYMLGNLIGASEKNYNKYIEESKELSLSLFYWLQTEVERPDGGRGWEGLRLRGDIMGTTDGMAKYPYIRESRRIKSQFTILEEHVGAENRKMVAKKNENADAAANFYDSVGVGYYHLDLHPSTGGDNYIDFLAHRFQIPLGALIPIRMKNLLPANKNIGTTHITNGCYRLHPVEWSIGEAVGLLIHYAMQNKKTPHEIRNNNQTLLDFQSFVRSNGIATEWDV